MLNRIIYTMAVPKFNLQTTTGGDTIEKVRKWKENILYSLFFSKLFEPVAFELDLLPRI